MTINGQRYRFSEVTLSLNGVRFMGIKEIRYDAGVTRADRDDFTVRVRALGSESVIPCPPGCDVRLIQILSRYWRRRNEWQRMRENRRVRNAG